MRKRNTRRAGCLEHVHCWLFPILAVHRLRRQLAALQETAALQEAFEEGESRLRREREEAMRIFAGYAALGWRGPPGYSCRQASEGAALEGRVVACGEAAETAVLIEAMAGGDSHAFLVLDACGGPAAPLIVQVAVTLFLESLRGSGHQGAFPAVAFMEALEAALGRMAGHPAMATGLVGSYAASSGRLSVLSFGQVRLMAARRDGSTRCLELPPSLPANAFGGFGCLPGLERRALSLTLEAGDSILAYAGEPGLWKDKGEGILAAALAAFRLDGPPVVLSAAASLAAESLAGAKLADEAAAVLAPPGRKLHIDGELAFAMGLSARHLGAGPEGEAASFNVEAESLRPCRPDCALLFIENRKPS